MNNPTQMPAVEPVAPVSALVQRVEMRCGRARNAKQDGDYQDVVTQLCMARKAFQLLLSTPTAAMTPQDNANIEEARTLYNNTLNDLFGAATGGARKRKHRKSRKAGRKGRKTTRRR